MRLTTPGGQYSALYDDMAKQPHLLIAGATGSGKSVVINGIISTLLTLHFPSDAQLILIDPKRVELVQYRKLPHTIRYASEPEEFEQALRHAMAIIDTRFRDMQKRESRMWEGGQVYVIIDELADLMTTCKKQCQPLIQRICQVGRASGVHLIAATQSPISQIISTPIKCNLDSRVALRTRSAQDSRNILGVAGCEKLPRYGTAYYMRPEGLDLMKIPMIPEETIRNLVAWWTTARCHAA